METMNFKATGQGNFVLEDKSKPDLFVSYRPGENFTFGPFFAPDDGQDETALFTNGKYYVLNGDFRTEYLEAFPNKDKCLEVYNKNRVTNRSSWSEDSNEGA